MRFSEWLVSEFTKPEPSGNVTLNVPPWLFFGLPLVLWLIKLVFAPSIPYWVVFAPIIFPSMLVTSLAITWSIIALCSVGKVVTFRWRGKEIFKVGKRNVR